jgi:hypothetical protein
VIVVVGQPLFRATDDGSAVDGLPARIALAAAARGRSVQLVGKAGEDPEGDAVVLALAEGGVGHVALLRDAGRPTPQVTEPTGFDLDVSDEAADDHSVIDDATVPSSASTALDAADVDLALRYLTDFAVVILAEPAAPDVIGVVADAAGWVGARLILLLAPGQTVPDRLPPDAIVFEAPRTDPDGTFGSLVGSLAAALDEGEEPGEAFHLSIEADGWAVSAGDLKD